jgi:hypothetical protein
MGCFFPRLVNSGPLGTEPREQRLRNLFYHYYPAGGVVFKRPMIQPALIVLLYHGGEFEALYSRHHNSETIISMEVSITAFRATRSLDKTKRGRLLSIMTAEAVFFSPVSLEKGLVEKRSKARFST